jgi:hypothetical protein
MLKYIFHKMQLARIIALMLIVFSPSGQSSAQACDTIRINAGSSASYTDHAGNVWDADRSHSGGEAVERAAAPIANTNDPTLYLTERFDVNNYTFALANCTYDITLHFAETYFDASGQRAFNVNIESNRVLSNFDPFVAAGGRISRCANPSPLMCLTVYCR